MSEPIVCCSWNVHEIRVAPREALLATWAHRSPLAQGASDHLPLVARLAPAASPGPGRVIMRRRMVDGGS